MVFKHFASENQLSGLSISRTLVENGLISFGSITLPPPFQIYMISALNKIIIYLIGMFKQNIA